MSFVVSIYQKKLNVIPLFYNKENEEYKIRNWVVNGRLALNTL